MKKTILMAFAVATVGSAQAINIMDQITGVTFSSGYASQDFEAANNAFDVVAMDDFTTVGGGNILTSIDAAMVNYNSGGVNRFDGVRNYRVEIYSDPTMGRTSLAGDVASVLVAAGSAVRVDSGLNAIVTIPVSIALSVNTTYWIGVMPEMDFGTSGQAGIRSTLVDQPGTPGGLNGWQCNPGGGFGIALNGRQIDGNGATAGEPGVNLGYRIEAVPEPGTVAALGLGFAAFVIRRRRK